MISFTQSIQNKNTCNPFFGLQVFCCFAINSNQRYLCLFLSKKSIDNTSNFTMNLCYSLETRLANFILTTSHNGIYREKHTEVSEYLGVTYRHLLYVIANFVKRGILEKSKQGYFIQDEQALREIATIDKDN